MNLKEIGISTETETHIVIRKTYDAITTVIDEVDKNVIVGTAGDTKTFLSYRIHVVHRANIARI